ncbi:MAG: hypothetical protein R2862_03485 [Thermoanaerobaculia bacterium]
MITSRLLAVGLLGILVAAPATAARHRSHDNDTVPNRLASSHTRNVEESIARFVNSGLLTPLQESAARDGLAAFSHSRETGQRTSTPALPADQFEFEPTAALLEATGSGVEADGSLTSLPMGLNSIGQVVCTIGDELLVNGRFVIVVSYQGFVGPPARAFSCRMTNSAGYFFFFDRTNIEIPVKMLNACFGGNPASHWVFAAGLTNFAVEITVFDLFTGIQKSYRNSLGQTFNTQIDQFTPFPCP